MELLPTDSRKGTRDKLPQMLGSGWTSARCQHLQHKLSCREHFLIPFNSLLLPSLFFHFIPLPPTPSSFHSPFSVTPIPSLFSYLLPSALPGTSLHFPPTHFSTPFPSLPLSSFPLSIFPTLPFHASFLKAFSSFSLPLLLFFQPIYKQWQRS